MLPDLVPGRVRVLAWLLGAGALVPAAFALSLRAGEYLWVWLATAGLAWLLWPRPSPAVLTRATGLALGFLFVVGQFGQAVGSAGQGTLRVAVVLALLAMLMVAVLVVARGAVGPVDAARPATGTGRTGRLGWLPAALGGLGLVGLIAVPLALGRPVGWSTVAQVAVAVLAWYAVRRASVAAPAARRCTGRILVGALVVVSLAGILRLAAVYAWRLGGIAAERAGQLQTAASRFQRAADHSAGLGLPETSQAMVFRLAGVRAAQGNQDEAARLLGLQPDLTTAVAASAWEGPVGGNLYYMESCWKDLMLYPGDLEITVQARGQQALGVWPLMQVSLGDRLLGQVSVAADTTAAYRFGLQLARPGIQRLQISFLNDYQQSKPPADRNLAVEGASLHYRSLAWN